MLTGYRLTRLAVCAACFGGLVGCSTTTTPGSDVTGPIPTTPAPLDASSHVRIVQVVSDAGKGINVSANGTVALTALPFATFFPYTQGEYQAVPGASQLAFSVTGGTTPFYNQVPPAVAAGAYATVIAFGRAASPGVTSATVVALSDTSLNAPTGVLVRVFNTVDYVSAGTGTPVDVYVYPQGSTRPTTPDVSGLAWGARSAYLAKSPGVLQVDVFTARAAGTGAPLFTGTVPTAIGSIRTVVLADPALGSSATAGAILALYDYR